MLTWSPARQSCLFHVPRSILRAHHNSVLILDLYRIFRCRMHSKDRYWLIAFTTYYSSDDSCTYSSNNFDQYYEVYSFNSTFHLLYDKFIVRVSYGTHYKYFCKAISEAFSLNIQPFKTSLINQYFDCLVVSTEIKNDEKS